LATFGMTHTELSRRSGLSRQTIADAYHSRPVSLETIIKIARALGVPLAPVSPRAAELLGGVG